MPKLNSIVFCDKAGLNTGSGKVSLEGIFDIIHASAFPARHLQMFVFVNVDIEAGEHEESFRIESPAGETIVASRPLKFTAHDGKHQFVHELTNLDFPQGGRYAFRVSIDDGFLGDNHFTVGK